MRTNTHGRSIEIDCDVVVVGCGAAGTVAAIEAAEAGARVVALDFWGRGGASARSGGVIYAGGGTPQQLAADFADDAEQMALYLAHEEGVPADDDRLRAFCERSRDDLAWLVRHGVTFSDAFDASKTIVPTDDDAGLYFSGNERQYAHITPPVPRGHRVAGHGMTGRDLVAALHAAARRSGATFVDGGRLVDIKTDGGRVGGIDAVVLSDDRTTRLARSALSRLVDLSASALRRVPAPLLAGVDRLLKHRGTPLHVHARQGVILATGGFSYNRALMTAAAPAFERTMPLGTPGDDGSGILSAQRLGAQVRLMDHCAASRFIAPPRAFCSGVLVDQLGRRVCDESLYAATLSSHIAEHGGRAWLIVDESIRSDARQQIHDGARLRDRHPLELLSGRANHVLFPKVFGRINLYANRRRGATLEALAQRCPIPADALADVVERYNECARSGIPDETGKPSEYLRQLMPPYSAIPCHLDSIIFPAPCITLGGLDVDQRQRVRRDDGSVIDGLYAAGRCAAGIASRSYVSGLSLADCVFSGRNAAIAAVSDRGESRSTTSTGAAVSGPEPG